MLEISDRWHLEIVIDGHICCMFPAWLGKKITKESYIMKFLIWDFLIGPWVWYQASHDCYAIRFWMRQYDNWRPPRKSRSTPKTTNAKFVRYPIIQSPQWFSELTNSTLEASNYSYWRPVVKNQFPFLNIFVIT